jgi:hypothetical protein
MQCRVHSVHTVNTHHCSFFPGYSYNSWMFCSNTVSCTLTVCTECTRHCITAEQPAIIGIPWKERTMVGINCMYRMYTTLYYCRTSSYYTIVLSFQGIPIIAGCSAVIQCLVHSVHTVNTHHCSFFPGYPYNSWMFCSNTVSCTGYPGKKEQWWVLTVCTECTRHCITAEQPAIIGISWKERTMVGINCVYRMYSRVSQ